MPLTITRPINSIGDPHMWSAVHLPIAYEIESDIYPYSTENNRTITSFDNNNGNIRLTLSGGFTSTIELDFVRITAAASPVLVGIFQVLQVESSNRYTIDLAYDSGLDKTGALVNPFYNNYAILVNVYAGWPGFTGASLPGYVKRTTLRFKPNEDNKVKFSISDVLKGFIDSINDLSEDALPNNYHNAVKWYLGYQEAWDEADVTDVIIPYVSDEVSDEGDYEGMGINCILPFKNIYSGYLTNYLMNNATAKFLTLFAIPVLFACQDEVDPCYQDISFLSPEGGGILKRDYRVNGQSILTVYDTIEDTGPGVYRVPLISPGVSPCAYDELVVQLTEEPPATPSFDQNPPTYNAVKDIGGNSWGQAVPEFIFSNTPAADASPFGNIHYWPLIMPKGVYTLSFDASRVNSGTVGGPSRFYIVGLDASQNVVDEQEFAAWSAGSDLTTGNKYKTGSFQFTVNDDVEYVGVWYHMDFPSPSSIIDHRIYALEITGFVPDTVAYSEEKHIRIDCGCSNQQIRLTWLNNLGGFDYWNFTAVKDYMVDIIDTGEQELNLLPGWPVSYGPLAQSIRRNTYRESRPQMIVRSGYVSAAEVDAISYIKSSILVQVIEGTSLRTGIVDINSFVVRRDNDKLHSIEFSLTFTDDIPSQTT